MPTPTDDLQYDVPDVSCEHCRASITTEVERVPGVSAVLVDLDAKSVRVSGARLDDDAVRAAIDAAGFDIA